MKQAELVFIPFPAFGHLTTAVENAKLLINRDQRLSITVLIINLPFDTGVTAFTQSLLTNPTDPRLRFMELPHHSSSSSSSSSNDVPQSSVMAFVSAFINSRKKAVRDVVADTMARSESSRLAGFVIDMLCTPMIDVANELGVPTYVFFTTSAALLTLFFHVQIQCDHHGHDITDYQNSLAELSVSGFANPIPVNVLPSILLDKEGGSDMMVATARRLREAKGIMLNTFLELEPHTFEHLAADSNVPPVYPVGPIFNLTNDKSGDDPIIRWLDHQPASSVVFLCFGSTGSFDEDQIKEIALALERSGQRFLWSLRRPPSQEMKTDQMPGEYEDPGEVLPEGFLERTAGIGKVIGWAPQVAVLSHGSVGGFVSHCGWNSILESLWFGVPMATWPLYGEHQLNAFQMVKELEIAVEIKLDYRKDFLSKNNTVEIVSAEEIESGIRRVMDGGSQVRKNVQEMREKSRTGMMEGGSSYTSLGHLIQEIVDQCH